MSRLVRHLFATRWSTRRRFPPACSWRPSRQRSARRNRGMAAKSASPSRRRWIFPSSGTASCPGGGPPQVFGQLGVWDTAQQQRRAHLRAAGRPRRGNRCRPGNRRTHSARRSGTRSAARWSATTATAVSWRVQWRACMVSGAAGPAFPGGRAGMRMSCPISPCFFSAG